MRENNEARGQDDASHVNPEGSRDGSDISIGAVVKFGIALVILMIFTYVLMGWLYNYFAETAERREPPPATLADVEAPRLPPEPRLQGAPGAGLPLEEVRALNEIQSRILNEYSWIDSERGIVRIPIEDAKRLMLERGLPVARQEGDAETAR